MNIPDIISLTAKGYKPAEIKEISALASTGEDIIGLAKACDGMDSLRELLELSSAPDPAHTPENVQPEEPAESVQTPQADTENEKLLKELEETRAELKAARKANASRDISGEVVKVEDRLADIMRSCY